MALTEQTRPYETLIRHNADGSIGAHHCTITEVLCDGVVSGNASINPPQPVAGAELEAVLGGDLAAALAYIPQLQAQVQQEQHALASTQQELQQTAAGVLQLQDLLAQRDQVIEQQQLALQAAEQATGALQASLDAAQAEVARLTEVLAHAAPAGGGNA